MKEKLIIYVSFYLLFYIYFPMYSADLYIHIKNTTSSNIKIIHETSNDAKSNTCNVLPEADYTIASEISEGSAYKIRIIEANTRREAHFNITNKVTNNDYKLKYYVPASGPITGVGCSWDNTGIIKLNGISTIKEGYWIPIISDSVIKASISILESDKSEKLDNAALETTLFALPENDKVQGIELDSTSQKVYSLKNSSFDLSARGVIAKSSLQPKVSRTLKSKSRWIDLIIHNFTRSSYLFYALKKYPGNTTIDFALKNQKNIKDIIYYPPFTQLRGPGFKFSVHKNNDGNYTVSPKLGQQYNNRYFFIIGKPSVHDSSMISYIPIEIQPSIYLGRSLEGGVNILSDDNTALNVNFRPVNCGFKLRKANSSKIEDIIRIPMDTKGHNLFKLKPMKGAKLKLEPQNSGSGVIQKHTCAATYIVSGEDPWTKEVVEFKVILAIPPFLNANTPGIYYPGGMIDYKYKVGNYIRYPMHLYVLPKNNECYDATFNVKSSITELPKNLIGSVEYFISDKIVSKDK